MKKFMKNSMDIIIGTPLIGVALNSIGNVSSSMKGLAGATQTMVSAGWLSKVSKMKWGK